MIEMGDVTKRVRQAIERARRDAGVRRKEADRATAGYGEFLEGSAAPVFRQVAAVLRAEGYPFQVFTPAGSVRLASDRSGEDFIELEKAARAENVIELMRDQFEMLPATRARIVEEAQRAGDILKGAGRDMKNVARHAYEMVTEKAEDKVSEVRTAKRKVKTAVRKAKTRARKTAAAA